MGLFGKLFRKSSDEPSQEVLALIAQLDDADPSVRGQAAKQLGDIGAAASSATEKLQELMNDDDGDVCNFAADAYSKVERGF